MEEGRVLNVASLEHRLDSVAALVEVELVDAREGQDAAGVDTDALDGELLSREVTTLNKECLLDVVGDAGEEFDLDLEALLSQNFASHMAAFDDSLS